MASTARYYKPIYKLRLLIYLFNHLVSWRHYAENLEMAVKAWPRHRDVSNVSDAVAEMRGEKNDISEGEFN